MIIAIDGNEANVKKRVGVSEFAFELLAQLTKIKDQGSSINVYLKESPLKDFPIEDKNWQYSIFGPKKLWTQLALPAHLFLQLKKPDVFFTPSHYAPRFSPCPTVISIMDLAYIHFPQLFAKKDLYQLQNWTKYSVKNASKIITISQSSKHDILNIYGVAEEKVAVIYPGIKPLVSLTPHVYPMQELKIKYAISQNFLLFVGTLQPRKNIARLIEAFSQLKKSKDKELQLVIVGKKGWLYEEILAAPEKFGVSESVKFLEFVSDDELAILYSNAKCFVFPSLYEGFGLPVLEAMQHDCPVITSNVSSLPEAGGDAALYVDPLDVEDMAKKIEKVLNDSNLRKEMIKKGREQVKKFSWEKAAKETLDVLQSVARNKS
ncbi:MAG TPA: glycosyltransferase family 1 protein [Patescibacteria group bacterium]|nr:glycosyltransferase family 1 protein [Patescibacteria group bacterium]